MLSAAGCAQLAPQESFEPVRAMAVERLGVEPRWPRSDSDRQAVDGRVRELLARPLDPDAAVEIAILNNRNLQAALEELAIADAERTQVGRLPNPGFSFGRLARGDVREIERSLHLNLARMFLLPRTGEIESSRLASIRAEAGQALQKLASDTRKAWIAAVATEEALRYARQVQEAAGAGAELARRMAAVGNFSKLEQAREHAFSSEAALALARAEAERTLARERLRRLLGLGETDGTALLPERLPDLPPVPRSQPEVRSALAARLDLRAARHAAERGAASLGLTRESRFINILEFGLQRNSSNHEPTERGWEISIELPIFDSGDARIARAEAVHRQLLHRAAATALVAQSEVREAWTRYDAGYRIARHWRDELVPLRKRISEENLLRYNGMLIGVFDLLADTRGQIASVYGYLDALKDFWLASADLDMSLIGPMSPAPSPAKRPAMGAGVAAGVADH